MGRPNQPMRHLIIEGLSTGMVTRSVDQFDDTNGEPIPIDPRSVPRAGDLPKLAQERKAKAEQAQAKQVQRTTAALNYALSTGMRDKFIGEPLKPFKRRI